MKMFPVILCGGNGSRLWPLSRETFPKQFLSLYSNQSMLQDVMLRIAQLNSEAPIFICNEEHRFIIAEQINQQHIQANSIILEPFGRNTAPAIAFAAFQALESAEEPLLFVLAADHVIRNIDKFIESVKAAEYAAINGKLVTFGIIPTEPQTGYGYIRLGNKTGSSFQIDKFIEKPGLNTAKDYIAQGNYLWNSGMFLFKASRYLEELKKFRPEIYNACLLAFGDSKADLDFSRIDRCHFASCPDESIDYAIMENTTDAVVVPMDAGWSDVGSWSSLWEVNEKDSDGNAIRGDVMLEDSHDSYIYSQNRLVAAVGVDDLVVVETKDAVLVAKKDKVQQVKEVVNRLKSEGRTEHLSHQEVFRPWGSHEAIAEGEHYHVKKVTVKPGQKTALQQHFHRAEHWIVVSGTAKVRNGDKTYLVSENESTFIPIGAAHSFENPGKVPLEIIEVRSGNYLKEDDIVRLDNNGIGY